MKNQYIVGFFALVLANTLALFSDACSPCSEQEESYCCAANTPHTYLRLRSQASNTARQLVGWQALINTLPEDPQKKVYGVFASTVEYQRSFNSRAIADYLLGCPTLHFRQKSVIISAICWLIILVCQQISLASCILNRLLIILSSNRSCMQVLVILSFLK